MTKIVILAAEPSGDALGASLIKAIKQRQPDVEISGLGGPMMAAQGLESWFDIKVLSVMGLVEVIPNIKRILKRIDKTAKKTKDVQPDIVLTTDAPDFNFRVVKRVQKTLSTQRGEREGERQRVRERGDAMGQSSMPPLPTPSPPSGGEGTRYFHVVAPSVWAWRPGRAKKIAKLYDGLLCLLPFEPPYFEKEGLKSLFIGHPVTQSGAVGADGTIYRQHAGITEGAQAIGLFFGSRMGELKRTAPIIAKAAYILQKENPSLHFIVPTLPHLADTAKTLTQGLNHVHITTDAGMKWSAFAACDRAMAVSGTVGLELAVAGIPHIIAYKANPITGAILKRTLKVPYVHLANIIMNQSVVPEFLLENCKAEKLAGALEGLDAITQTNAFKNIRAQLTVENADALLSDFILN